MCGSKGSAPTPSGASTTTGGTSAGTSTTNFAQGPTGATGQRYEDFLNKITTLANTPFDPAMQTTVAPLNPFQNTAIQQMFDVGSSMGTFDPAQVRQIESPYIQDVVEASQNWFNNQNAIQSNDLLGKGIQSGNAFGGDRMGVAQAQMAGQQQLAQAPVIAGLYQSGYGQALDEYNRLKTFGVTGAEEAMKAGTVQQAQTQREADVATANAQQRGAYPFQVANWQGAALGGVGPLTGTVGTGITATQANSTGITNPPSPNPLAQALGIGSSLVGLGSAIFGKDGGSVGPRGFASGGYADDDSSRDDDDERDRNRSRSTDDSDTNVQTSGTQDEVLHDIQQVGKQTPTQPETPNIFGKFKVPRYRNQYAHIPNLGAQPNTGMQQSINPVASPLQQQSSSSSTGSNVGGAIGAIGGSIFGGPVGGAIGGGVGRLFGGLFGKDGGIVPHLADGGPDDEGDTGDTKDQGDPAASFDERFGKWREPSRTGPVVREIPTEPPAAGTGIVPARPARPSIPTPDPLAPYLGTEGPRSVTGPGRGSPAGINPQQAREVSPLALTRERVQRELEDNPRLARTFDANTTAEVGVRPRARQGYQAATIDRAVQTGQPLARVVNAPDYYPWSTRASRRTTGQGVDESLWAGANPVNFGTGNASRGNTGRDVGFAGGPQTASIGAERYGIEGQAGLPYARAAGYTGPDRTVIGFGPGAPVGTQVTQLAGGDNTSGDLEVSAQSRRPGAGQPGGTNLGYGPVTSQQIPELGRPPRDWSQRWAVNPFTQAGIAMLRSQSPYFATGLGEGLAGAAGAIEHTREEQVLDAKPVLRTDFPTLMYQRGDGTMIDTHVPNPSYDAKSVPRDRLELERKKFEYDQSLQKGQKWKPTGMVENGRIILYNEQTGQTKLGDRVGSDDKPIPTTVAPAASPVTPDAGKTTATWMPNLTPDPNDPALKELVPDQGPIPKKTLEDRNKANIKTMDTARKQQEDANQQIGRMNQMETALEALPKTGFMSPGYLAGYNATIAQAINHAARMVGANEQFTANDVANMEEANKIKTIGGFLQSRLTGGGQHNAATIINASMRAYPGAENSPQGAALIIAANREVSQRDRDYYEFLTKHGNTTFRGDLNAATLYFNRIAPMEKYIERARAKVEARFGPNPAVAPTTQQPTTQQPTTGPQPMPEKPDVIQNGHTYRWNGSAGKYQVVQ